MTGLKGVPICGIYTQESLGVLDPYLGIDVHQEKENLKYC